MFNLLKILILDLGFVVIVCTVIAGIAVYVFYATPERTAYHPACGECRDPQPTLR